MDIPDQVEKNFGKTRLEAERLQPLGRPMETPNDFDEIVQKLEEMETHIWTDLDTANFETAYSHAMVEFLLNTAPQPILLVPASLSGLEIRWWVWLCVVGWLDLWALTNLLNFEAADF